MLSTTGEPSIAYIGSSSIFEHPIESHVHLLIILDKHFEILDDGQEGGLCIAVHWGEGTNEPVIENFLADR